MVDKTAGNSVLGSFTQHMRSSGLSQKSSLDTWAQVFFFKITTLATRSLAILAQVSVTLRVEETLLLSDKDL